MTTLAEEFKAADQQRATVLQRARKFAAQTIPRVLPEADIKQNSSYIFPYQILGATGVTNLIGKLLVTLFPTVTPWFSIKPSSMLVNQIDPRSQDAIDALLEFEKILILRELQIMSFMNTTKYRNKMRSLLEHIIIIGSSLGQVLSNEPKTGKIQTHRFDTFVHKRDGEGEVLWLMHQDALAPEEISDEDIAKSGINIEELKAKPVGERHVVMTTRAVRQQSGGMVIKQEMNEKIIRESEEKVTSYLTAGYIEQDGEDYSRSFVEERYGALAALNGCTESILDFSAEASKIYPVIDINEPFIRPKQLMLPTGTPLRGNVKGGIVQGVGYIKTDKQADMRVTLEVTRDIQTVMGKQFLVESEVTPTGERVTATQVIRVARQLEGALGAPYSQIAEELQRPYLDRVIHLMERDNLLVPIPEKFAKLVNIEIFTGLEALGRQADLEKLVSAVQMLSTMPEAAAKINLDALVQMVFAGHSLDQTTLVKTQEQQDAEAQAAIAANTQRALGEQAVETGGKIVENAAAQG